MYPITSFITKKKQNFSSLVGWVNYSSSITGIINVLRFYEPLWSLYWNIGFYWTTFLDEKGSNNNLSKL
ncbi:hypothetical protein BpHYR1_045334 [Brachionus plicatilis]|uniref:Uncharacterized protein n=1 Tax=Brachionus plicatilis TaxID=10195 RepID=A0A3M7QV09_BRAPC|nr:hypothetical protein BpHYR1_045334 [Brachionus plicatilis]